MKKFNDELNKIKEISESLEFTKFQFMKNLKIGACFKDAIPDSASGVHYKIMQGITKSNPDKVRVLQCNNCVISWARIDFNQFMSLTEIPEYEYQMFIDKFMSL